MTEDSIQLVPGRVEVIIRAVRDVAADRLVAAILDFLPDDDLLPRGEIREQLEREIGAVGCGAVVTLKARLSEDNGWTYYAPDPVAQRVHHVLADRFLQPDSGVDGLQNITSLPGAPVVICANHLSYADANVIETLPHRTGARALANRITALAGPKVFISRQRRFSSLCFGTIKVPQSADVASGEAHISPRDVARAARQAIGVAHTRLSSGDVLLLFGEGTRSRTGAMQRMLPAVARYLEVPNTIVVPVGITGPETLFPVDRALRPARVRMRIGAPVQARSLFGTAKGDRRIVVDAIGEAIAALLPPDYRGAYSSGH